MADDTTTADAPAEEYSSVGWWKDVDGNVHHGSVHSTGYLKASEKGTGAVPDPEPEPETQDVDEAKQLAELKAAAEAEALAAAEKAEADRVAAEKAEADRNRSTRRGGRATGDTDG